MAAADAAEKTVHNRTVCGMCIYGVRRNAREITGIKNRLIDLFNNHLNPPVIVYDAAD